MRSNEGDKIKIGEIIVRMELEEFETAPNHECSYVKFKDPRYYPKIC